MALIGAACGIDLSFSHADAGIAAPSGRNAVNSVELMDADAIVEG